MSKRKETGEKCGGLETSRPVRVFLEWIVLIFQLFYFLLAIFAFAHLSSADLRFQFGRSLCEEAHQPFQVLRGGCQQELLADIP